jgi:hypothetical protein
MFFGGVKTNFEEAATFGAQTTSIFAKEGGHPIHCMDSRDANGCIEGARSRSARNSVLWLGNSQLHAINQMRLGEMNAPPILFESLYPRGLDLLTFSQPNANLQEHYVLFEYLRKQLPLRLLILSIVFDDLREDGLRDEVAALTRDEQTSMALSATDIGRRLLVISRFVAKDQDTAGIAQTIQERAELTLNGWLEEQNSLWKVRPMVRGKVFYGLYVARNALFGIKATSKRKIIQGRYNDNLAALAAILNAARREGIEVVLYIAPLRGGMEIPYDSGEYARFKSDIQRLARLHNARYANLEALVPNELWDSGTESGANEVPDADFMHFQAGGHKVLAAKLEQLVTDSLANLDIRP